MVDARHTDSKTRNAYNGVERKLRSVEVISMENLSKSRCFTRAGSNPALSPK